MPRALLMALSGAIPVGFALAAFLIADPWSSGVFTGGAIATAVYVACAIVKAYGSNQE